MTYEPNPRELYLSASEAARFLGMTIEEFHGCRGRRPAGRARMLDGPVLYRLDEIIEFRGAERRMAEVRVKIVSTPADVAAKLAERLGG